MDEKEKKNLEDQNIEEILREEKERKKKKKGMLSTIFTVLVLSICVGGFCFSAYTLYGYYRTYKDGEKEYERLRTYIDEESESADSSANGDSDSTKKKKKTEKFSAPKVDFDELEDINKDIIGWIKVQGTVINYPIVQGEDNTYYLKKTFEKKSNYSGAIFMDYLNASDFSSDNTILYGHNLKTGEMFGGLQKYKKKDYFKKHKYIWIVTPDSKKKYEIFASYVTDERSEVYTLEFNDFEEMDSYFRLAKENSYFSSDSILLQDDKILTLSTCVTDSDEERRVVQAKLIKEEKTKSSKDKKSTTKSKE